AYLQFNEDTMSFVISGRSGQELISLSTGLDPRDDDLRVRFHQILPLRGAEITGRHDRSEVDVVTFHPDRSSMPFEAEIRQDGYTSTHRYDPFSDVEIEEEGR